MAAQRILAGASGYSFKEWKGSFYPDDMKPEGMLAWYGERLPTVEINNTFYQMPKVAVLENWARATPEAFRFAIKASRRITHMARLKADSAADSVAYLYKNLAALGAKRGPVLFQLPPFLKKDLARLDEFLQLLPPAHGAAFEFRGPGFGLLEHCKRLGKSAEAAGFFSRLQSVCHRLLPILGPAIVKGEQFQLFLETPLINLFDGNPGSLVQGLLAGFAGVVVLASGKTEGGNVWHAAIAGTCAAFLYGIGANLLKRYLVGVPASATASATLICAGVLLSPLAIATWPTAPVPAKSWLSAVLLGVLCTGIAYVLFYRLIYRIGAPRASTVTYLIPLFGVMWAWLLLDEAVTRTMAIACLLILGGVALSQQQAK